MHDRDDLFPNVDSCRGELIELPEIWMDDETEFADRVARRVLELLDARESRDPPNTLTTREAAARLGVSYPTLRRMVADAPANLPGHPTDLSPGRARKHLRWDAQRLQEWAAAYDVWKNPKAKPRATRRRRRAAREAAGGAVDWGAVGRGERG